MKQEEYNTEVTPLLKRFYLTVHPNSLDYIEAVEPSIWATKNGK